MRYAHYLLLLQWMPQSDIPLLKNMHVPRSSKRSFGTYYLQYATQRTCALVECWRLVASKLLSSCFLRHNSRRTLNSECVHRSHLVLLHILKQYLVGGLHVLSQPLFYYPTVAEVCYVICFQILGRYQGPGTNRKIQK